MYILFGMDNTTIQINKHSQNKQNEIKAVEKLTPTKNILSQMQIIRTHNLSIYNTSLRRFITCFRSSIHVTNNLTFSNG